MVSLSNFPNCSLMNLRNNAWDRKPASFPFFFSHHTSTYLDEDDLVMLLRRCDGDGLPGSWEVGLWWRHVHVHVLVDGGRLSGCPVLRGGAGGVTAPGGTRAAWGAVAVASLGPRKGYRYHCRKDLRRERKNKRMSIDNGNRLIVVNVAMPRVLYSTGRERIEGGDFRCLLAPPLNNAPP